ncbi:phospholipid/cholesterol/gamma-HCH transport system substrate-binding protein [Mariniflexile fucanivorans]|uniref:Phospholipid/cholesterol/gamma-HCH transport system substrate-binding protein n=1 Tax=Mariniflexile fucanivorans TaxID=264023 RepID=A0A4R1RBM5_9FLAO|nr:MlaD family protein [Mariniflexile fucanivorans]TCL63089.1 phospholipid/cholesterol/gamma-HCH transport system substrate-binding protein [Mariniflexile fucanivorans]
MKISKEVKTGILVLSGIALFIFGFNYLKGRNIFEPTDVFYTEFDYNSLSKSSPVTVMGNSVGKIEDISYNYDTGKTRVAFTVSEQLKFSKNSVVKMYETGLMGGNALAILISNEGEQAEPGDVLPSEVEFGLVTNLSKNFSGVTDNLDSTLKSTDTLMVSINKLVNDNSDAGLKRTIEELNYTLKSFKTTSNTVNETLSKNDKNITAILDKFKTISADLAVLTTDLKDANVGATVENLNVTLNKLNGILATIDKGEGSLGKLLKDEGVYNNLEGASLQLEQLLQDMKLNPKRYVHFSLFGKKAKQYEAEEN